MANRQSGPKSGRPIGAGRRSAFDRVGFGHRLLGCVFLVLVSFPGLASAAGETMHEVIWAHPDALAVKRFVVFVSTVKGDQAGARRVDVGKPQSQPSGTVQVFSAIVPIGSAEFIAVAAVGYDGRMGALSSWSGVPPTRPGQPIVIEP